MLNKQPDFYITCFVQISTYAICAMFDLRSTGVKRSHDNGWILNLESDQQKELYAKKADAFICQKNLVRPSD
jgi:hypothetical protein